MDLTAKLTDVHRRSAAVLLRLQDAQAQAQQVQALVSQCQAELLRLDGEERAVLALKAQAEPAKPAHAKESARAK